jgi:hypothetical protein
MWKKSDNVPRASDTGTIPFCSQKNWHRFQTHLAAARQSV